MQQLGYFLKYWDEEIIVSVTMVHMSIAVIKDILYRHSEIDDFDIERITMYATVAKRQANRASCTLLKEQFDKADATTWKEDTEDMLF